MKNFFLVFLISTGLFSLNQHGFAQGDEQKKINLIKNDPDWQIIAKSQGQVVNTFVSGKIDIAKFDFNNENLFLKTINMSKEQYQNQVQLNREAANRLKAKYDMRGGTCIPCTKTSAEQINTLRSVLMSFKNNPDAYSAFKQHSLGIEPKTTVAGVACCGFWFYVCAAFCTTALTTVGPFLLCIAMCVHEYCCHPITK